MARLQFSLTFGFIANIDCAAVLHSIYIGNCVYNHRRWCLVLYKFSSKFQRQLEMIIIHVHQIVQMQCYNVTENSQNRLPEFSSWQMHSGLHQLRTYMAFICWKIAFCIFTYRWALYFKHLYVNRIWPDRRLTNSHQANAFHHAIKLQANIRTQME